ncbi:MAG: hypothetical protein J7K13_04150, partial [Thermoplasmata archaeon]|nr:hypothetical protein [Thermoplasmata archaeon]
MSSFHSSGVNLHTLSPSPIITVSFLTSTLGCIVPKLLSPEKIGRGFSFYEEAEPKKDKMDHQKNGKGRKKCLQDSKVTECNT